MTNYTGRGLIQPLVGGDTAAWGGYLNNDLGYITQMFGSVLELSVTSGATLTTTQTQNGVIRFTGTLTSNVVVTFPNTGPGGLGSGSGVWWIDNRTVNTGTNNYYVKVQLASGSNATIGLPQGVVTPIRVESGTDGSGTSYPGVSFVNAPTPGTYWDYGSATVPNWFNGCTTDGSTVQYPWLVCDGSTYSVSLYPYLAAILGTTFGGNGITTFGVPDLGNRARVSIKSSSPRLTTAVSGIDGSVLGSGASTSESTTLSSTQIPAHQHNVYLNDPGHNHVERVGQQGAGSSSGLVLATQNNPANQVSTFDSTAVNTTGMTIGPASGAGATGNITAANTGGGGAHTNVQPTLVSGLTFIKT